jgi:hypothetical protein
MMHGGWTIKSQQKNKYFDLGVGPKDMREKDMERKRPNALLNTVGKENARTAAKASE